MIVGGIKKVFKKIPGFHDKPIPEGEFDALKKSFVNWCRKKAEDMSFGVEKDKREEFLKQAEISTGRIADVVFSKDEIPRNRQESGALLMKANTQALIVLTDLKRLYPPDKTPQVFVGKDGKLTIAKAAPKVESLVLQGGGGKGIGYPPVFEEMEKTGMLKEVDLLVGTSIGRSTRPAWRVAAGPRTRSRFWTSDCSRTPGTRRNPGTATRSRRSIPTFHSERDHSVASSRPVSARWPRWTR